MKLRNLFILSLSLFLCGIFLLGCSTQEEAPDVTTEPAQFPLPLPDGFTMVPKTTGTYDILHNGQTVGGFVETKLTADDLLVGRPLTDEFYSYLESYIVPPLEMEFMAGSGICNVQTEVSLIAYDVEAKKGHEYDHYLFSQNSVCYDLWLDTELIDSKASNQLLITAGLYDSRVIFTPGNGFLEPEGCDFTDFTSDRCSIFKEDTKVGGIIATGLEADSLDSFDVDAYVSTLGPFPKYISMRSDDFISVTVKCSQENSGPILYTQHFLFLREGVCYDLWLDNDLIDQKERTVFLEAAGIQ